MPSEVLEVTKRFMRNPIQILIKKEELTLEGIRQFYISIDKEVYIVAKNYNINSILLSFFIRNGNLKHYAICMTR